MSHAEAVFWRGDEKYHDLVEMFEGNIQMTHPEYTTSDRICRVSYHCIWGPTSVKYFEYRGPNI